MPQSHALPGPEGLVGPFFRLQVLLMAFVREILGWRQARPSVSLNAGGGLAGSCTI